jgi:hypothetical protein
MSGYAFHPGERDDLDEIWDYIAADNLDAAYRDSYRNSRGSAYVKRRVHVRLDLIEAA